MTHEYWILTGGVIAGTGQGARQTTIAWAADTVLAIGGGEDVRAISRGDSHFADLRGGVVRPLTGAAPLEPGGRADFEIVDATSGAVIAIVFGGRLVAGDIPGLGLA